MINRIVVLLLLSAPIILAQFDTTAVFENIVNDVIENSPAEDESSSIIEHFEELYYERVNINSSNIFDLQRVPFLNGFTAHQIIDHRNKYGRFFSLNELYSIKNIDTAVLKKIIPFIGLGESDNKKPSDISGSRSALRMRFRSRITSDIKNNTPYNYPGRGYKSYFKFQSEYSYFKAGILAEKDAGEISHTDFSSFYLQADDLFFTGRVVAGDYTVEFGQGLVLSGPYRISKSAETLLPVKNSRMRIYPYSGSDENRFFRGAASEINTGLFDLTLFYSSNRIDARIDSVTELITSLPIDGYHRTHSELLKKDAASERVYGTIIRKNFDNLFQLGVVYYNSKFDRPIENKSSLHTTDNIFNYFSFSYDVNIQPVNIFGETAAAFNKTAIVTGLTARISEAFSYSLLFRHYPKDLIILHGNSFRESGGTAGETGIYSGIKIKSAAGVFNIYFDQFLIPLKLFPSSAGHDFLFDYKSPLIRKTIIHFTYKYENKENELLVEDKGLLTNCIKERFRAEVEFNVNKLTQLKTRVEYVSLFNKAGNNYDTGLLLYSDLKTRFEDLCTANFRFIVFDTKNYNSAVYEYEQGNFGMAALFGEGYRWYVLLRFMISAQINLSLKYSQTSRLIEKIDKSFGLQFDFNY